MASSWWRAEAEALGAQVSSTGSWRRRCAAFRSALVGKTNGGNAGRHLLATKGAQQTSGSYDKRIVPTSATQGGSNARRIKASGAV